MLNVEKFRRDFKIEQSEAAIATDYKAGAVIQYLNGSKYSELFFRRLCDHLEIPFREFEKEYICHEDESLL